MATNVGIKVNEGVANGLTPFVSASKHNVGVLWERERGIPFKPVKCSSLQEDRLRFGGVMDSSYGAVLARNIYKNAGAFGATIHGVRMLTYVADESTGSKTASGTLTDGAPTNQAFAETIATAAGVGVSQVVHFTASNPSVGDTFVLTAGTTPLEYEVQVGDTPATIHAALAALIQDEIDATNADWTPYTVGLGAADAHIIVTVVATNTANSIAASTVNGSAVTIMELFAGQTGFKDPGTWGNDLVAKFYPKNHAEGLKNLYLCRIYYKTRLVEEWSGATWSAILTLINDQSNYLYASSGNLEAFITDIQTVTLSGGTYVAPSGESDYYPVTGDEPSGLALLDGVDVQIIFNADYHTEDMAVQGRDYCFERGNAIYVASLPYLATSTVVEDFADALQQGISSFVAGYLNWVKTSDENGSFIWVPSIGCVIGAGYIRVPNLNKDRIFTPPGGLDSAFVDVSDITHKNLSQTNVNNYVRNFTCNVVITRPGKGFFIASSRTYSTDPKFHSVHIRRQTSYYVATLETNMLWVAQKPLTPELDREIYVSLYTYFLQEYNDGGLERSIPFTQACEIVIDKSNNPPTQDRKLRNVDINWIPTEQTESLTINLNRNDGVLIASAV